MVTQFRGLSKDNCPGRIKPCPQSQISRHQFNGWKHEAKGLASMATKSGEIMWVHPDIVKDEQWESSKLKGKSCNVASLAADDDVVTVASLSDSEEEKIVLAA